MLKPDFKQERPSPAEKQAIWKNSIFAARARNLPPLTAFLAIARSAFVNGGVEFACFSVADNPTLDWFISRNRINEVGFLKHLLTSDAFQSALPQVKPPEALKPIEWSESSSYALDGDLASLIKTGGAYESYKGTGHEAKKLAQHACEALFANRYEDILVFTTNTPWSPWFHDVAWDFTCVVIDKKEREVCVLCVTDTD